MAEYIDRDALIEWLKRIPLKDLSDGLGLCRVIMEDDFKKAIKKMPKGIIADVAPVRHGQWIGGKYDPETGDYMEKCSHCGVFSKEYWKPHCSECGAKMDGVDDG